MKEASGELNMTAVTVIAIGAIAAFFYAFVWPNLKSNIDRSQKCSTAICNCSAGQETAECTFIDANNATSTVTCPCKN